MKRVIFDFEFVPGNPCLPISVAMVDVDIPQSWLYLEWPQAKERAHSNDWLAANVGPYLKPEARTTEGSIAFLVAQFLCVGPSSTVRRDDLVLYADCGAYDFFLLSETLGGFSESGLPYTYRELAHMNLPDEPLLPGEHEHNALDDVLRLARAFRRMEDANRPSLSATLRFAPGELDGLLETCPRCKLQTLGLHNRVAVCFKCWAAMNDDERIRLVEAAQ